MKFIKYYYLIAARCFLRRKAKDSFHKLCSHQNQTVQNVAAAFLSSLNNASSTEEEAWMSLIEKRRSELLESSELIVVKDFGAGGAGSVRNQDEMFLGVNKTTNLSTLCKASKPAFWARIMFNVIRKVQPSSCIELGACVGISASYQAAALKMNGCGHLTSLEGSPETAKIAEKTLQALGLDNATIVTGAFYETLSGVVETASPIDFFFNDGHHDHDAVLEYFNKSIEHFADETIIIFDDISWSQGMRKAWCSIEKDERVAITIDLGPMGLAIISKGYARKEKFHIPLEITEHRKSSLS